MCFAGRLPGNWGNFTTKASGTTNLNQTRTANAVNEITNITESTGPTWIVPDYDDAGNTVVMPQVAAPTQPMVAVYDAWNRMVSLSVPAESGSSSSSSSSSSSRGGWMLLAQYQYDGRNFRIVKQTYSDGYVSETRDFYFTANWQDIEEQVGGTTEDQYVWGIRYIDELICRDEDGSSGSISGSSSSSSSSSSEPVRLYATQDANFNLTSISDTSGSVVERYLFDPYGNRTIMNSSWSIITSSDYEWVIGHQGLILNEESGLIYVRYRPLQPVLGRWMQRRDGVCGWIKFIPSIPLES